VSHPPFVRNFASNSPEYQRAFEAFLSHTDQKKNARARLAAELDRLPRRRTLIDAGAGNGELTAWAAPRFERVVAVEPNPGLAAELRVACPRAEVLAVTILEAGPQPTADFVLCSHVFYYIPDDAWAAHLHRLMDWLAPGGVLAIALQNPGTDCMRMLEHFVGRRVDSQQLRQVAEVTAGGAFEVRLDTVPAHITTDDLETACVIAEFMLNLLPMPSPPPWPELERYVRDHFQRPGQGYVLSCHQDFLWVARPL
jgi:SAM-dependent methyltransferase